MNAASKEQQVIAGLKDFQRATVNRIHKLFLCGHNRILVADEVGLGKTLIARGVLAKTMQDQQEISRDEPFKAVYICSNQSIAGQNLSKLMISSTDRVEGLADTRLSMQHLKIFEIACQAKEEKNRTQLIPLTPQTSFSITRGSGSVGERALMFSIFCRHRELAAYCHELEILMKYGAEKGWNFWAKEYYEKRVIECDRDSEGEYLGTVLSGIEQHFQSAEELYRDLITILDKIRLSGEASGFNQLIVRLRRMMAEVSLDLLKPDLVILDEFQRFPDLLRNGEDDEKTMLARRFFSAAKPDEINVKVLLLSATPFRLYSTLEEITDKQIDEHYQEFMQVVDFLHENQDGKKLQFRQIWRDYAAALNEISSGNSAVLFTQKGIAEKALYESVCRTERLIVAGAGDLLSCSIEDQTLNVSENDVLSYVEAEQLLKNIGFRETIPVEYIKSTPFVLSFMEHYKIKERIRDYFINAPGDIKAAQKSLLWIDERLVEAYEVLPETNAKLKMLIAKALPPGAEMLLWIPPSKPYYQPGGPFQQHQGFSKLLIFSAWQMVPKAIAVMLSYEAERRTIGELMRQRPNSEREKRGYFPQKKKVRFPAPRLKFNLRNGTAGSMNLMCLLYPSVTLAKIFDPVSAMNRGLSRNDIETELRDKVEKLIEELPNVSSTIVGAYDERWYSLAPLLFDRSEDLISKWLSQPEQIWDFKNSDTDEEEEGEHQAMALHFSELSQSLKALDGLRLGRRPQDLTDVLVDMAMASPAVCAMRLVGCDTEFAPPLAARLAKTIFDRFNAQEATSIVELTYKTHDPHWRNVLRYCVDGNLQSVLDEYAHMLIDDNGLRFVDGNTRAKNLIRTMHDSLKTHTASYNVDTFKKFSERTGKRKLILPWLRNNDEPFKKMRSGFAAGFYDLKESDKSLQRKSNLRAAFNSPFRPFVLTTTSIGQEGLDFHFYCRKIVHWNLPSNPVDLEQREGRINRYKCLAIRQNIAHQYGEMKFSHDVWQEMFEQANAEEKGKGQTELVPFWCLPGETKYKIERIVPMYPLSRDQGKYERLIKILSLYRLSLGQPRQQELLEYVLQSDLDEDQIKKMFINLSPICRETR